MWAFALAIAVAIGLAGCGGAPPASTPRSPLSALVPTPVGALARIEVKRLEARPQLTLVSRDGDPYPAVAVAVATDQGAAASTAIAAMLEHRLQARGFHVTSRADRDAAHLLWTAKGAPDVEAFVEAVREAFREPISGAGAELDLARQRLASLARHPFESPALDAIAECTGRLGAADGSRVPSLAGPEGAAALETWRRSLLVTGRSSIAGVGPAAFCGALAEAVADTDGWPLGPEPSDRAPLQSSSEVATSGRLDSGAAELTVAMRVGDPRRAVAAAERLGEWSSPLAAKLPTLSTTWSVVEVVGAARARGGCVSVTVRASNAGEGADLSKSAAAATALVRREIVAETSALHEPTIASRQILGATDPRAAAQLAAWWALSSATPGDVAKSADDHMSVILVTGAASTPHDDVALGELRDAFTRAVAASRDPAPPGWLEHRFRVERGQSSFWLLLASPCGAASESEHDAGLTAIAALAAVESATPPRGVELEAWITPDGVGVLARGALTRDDTPEELARRVADTAAQVIASTRIRDGALPRARAMALAQLERHAGPTGEALEIFASRAQPAHPSWIMPLGFRHTVSSSLDAVQMRWNALALSPLRVAILANADTKQVAVATRAIERWLPTPTTSCEADAPSSAITGRVDAELASHTLRAQAIVGARVPPEGDANHALAELTAWALEGQSGRLESALAPIPGARAHARVLGGRRAAALAIDIRAPADRIAPAAEAVAQALDAMSREGIEPEEQKRAWTAYLEHKDELLADPRTRLAQLWHGYPDPVTAPTAPTASAWKTFIGSTLGPQNRIEVIATPR